MTRRSLEDTIHLADDMRKMARENPPPTPPTEEDLMAGKTAISELGARVHAEMRLEPEDALAHARMALREYGASIQRDANGKEDIAATIRLIGKLHVERALHDENERLRVRALERQVADHTNTIDAIAALLRDAGVSAQPGSDGQEDLPASVHFGLGALRGRIETLEASRDTIFDLLPTEGVEREAVLHAIAEYDAEYVLPEAQAWSVRMVQGLKALESASEEGR